MPAGGDGGSVARLGEHERSRAERHLRGARLPAPQPEQRRLLVAERSAHRDPLDLGVDRVGVDDRREHPARHAEQLEQLVVPVEPAERAQQRSGGVPDVRDVHAAEPVQQPGRDVAVREIEALDAVEQPAQLRRRERGVELEPGPLADAVAVEPGAGLVGAAVLPHDRRVDRAAGVAVPDDERLRLVGDAEGRDIARPGARRLERPGDRAPGRLRELLRVLLHEPGPGNEQATGTEHAPRSPSSASTATQRVLEVPWSSPASIVTAVLRSLGPTALVQSALHCQLCALTSRPTRGSRQTSVPDIGRANRARRQRDRAGRAGPRSPGRR